MRILYIHQYFNTLGGTSGTRSYEFARALVRRGHAVTVLCASSAGGDTGATGPFARGRREGEVDGIRVVEFDVHYSNYDSVTTRARKFARFAWRTTRDALLLDYDVIFVTSTPLTVVLPGIAARCFRQKPFVFEVRDLWPELPRALGLRNPIALAAMHVLEWLGYRNADRLVALAPGIKAGIMRLGVPEGRIALIPNACDLGLFDDAQALRPCDVFPEQIAPGNLVAVFAGAHGRANGLEAALSAAHELQLRGRHDIKLLLVGDGTMKPRLLEMAARLKLKNVVFSPPIAKARLAGLLKGVDIGLQLLANVPAFYDGTSPNKFFDYLAARRPVLINYPGWLGTLVRDTDCGFVVPPDNPGAFADALIEAADDRQRLAAMGVRARMLGQKQFDRVALSENFVHAVESLARR